MQEKFGYPWEIGRNSSTEISQTESSWNSQLSSLIDEDFVKVS